MWVLLLSFSVTYFQGINWIVMDPSYLVFNKSKGNWQVCLGVFEDYPDSVSITIVYVWNVFIYINSVINCYLLTILILCSTINNPCFSIIFLIHC
jgi:hypothetical protein